MGAAVLAKSSSLTSKRGYLLHLSRSSPHLLYGRGLRATAAFTRSGADDDCSTTDDESHRDAGRGAGDRRHINPKLKVTCLGGLPSLSLP